MDFLAFVHLLNGLLMLALPLGLAFFLARRFHPGWRIWFIGAGTFVLSQVWHIPFNSVLLNPLIQTLGTGLSKPLALLVSAVLLGLSAGIFEEGMRWVAYRFWVKDARTWSKGLFLGAGHGGIEALILAVLVLVGFVNMFVMRNIDLTQLVPPAQLATAQQQVTAYWSMPWYNGLLGVLERIFAIPAHLFMSLLVMQAFTRRKIYWLGLAVLFHTLLDATAVYLLGIWGGQSWGTYALEGVIGLFAVFSVVMIFVLRQPEPSEPAAPTSGDSLSPAQRQPIEVPVTPEKLDDSRYN